MDNKEEMTVKTEEKAKPYTLRRLKDRDLFPILDIIGKVLPDNMAAIAMGIVTGNKTVEEVGGVLLTRIVASILQNMKTVHDDVYAFLSDVSGIPVEEIEEMEFGTTPRMIWDIVKNEKNNDFFEELSKLS